MGYSARVCHFVMEAYCRQSIDSPDESADADAVGYARPEPCFADDMSCSKLEEAITDEQVRKDLGRVLLKNV